MADQTTELASGNDDDSRVMRGTDGGTWVESLNVTPIGGHTSTNYSILYFVAEYQGKLYTQIVDTIDGIRPYSHFSDDNGTTWQQGANIILHIPPSPNSSDGKLNFRHEIFANKLVMKQDSHLTSFDGTNAESLVPDIRNFTVRDGWLYVLEESGRISRTQNLTNWPFVDMAPSNASSIEVLDNDIYVGTEDAEVYWKENILDELPRVPLAPMYLLLLDD